MLTVSRRLRIIWLTLLIIILGIIPLLGTLYSSVHDARYMFQASVFRNMCVTVSLIVFIVALCRITSVVRGLKSAFPNRKRTFIHFFLAISVLLSNLCFLVYAFIYYQQDHKVTCSVTEQKFFFVLTVFSFGWDLVEFSLQILLLTIVLKYTRRAYADSLHSSQHRYNAH